jgi:hypothetical protein
VSTIIAYIQEHPGWSWGITVLIFSHFVGALPSPDIQSGKFYQFLFSFLTSLTNLARATSSKLPVAVAQAHGVEDAKAIDAARGPEVSAPPKP